MQSNTACMYVHTQVVLLFKHSDVHFGMPQSNLPRRCHAYDPSTHHHKVILLWSRVGFTSARIDKKEKKKQKHKDHPHALFTEASK